MSRKPVAFDDRVPVRLSLAQRELIINETFAGEDLTDRLRHAEVKSRFVTVGYTIPEVEELAGYVAAEANHAKDRRLEARLDGLYETLTAVEDGYQIELASTK